MHFLAYPFPPAAAAAGVVSRVQLPAVGRSACGPIELGSVKKPPVAPAADGRRAANLAQHRAQHRAHCRAACRAKANF